MPNPKIAFVHDYLIQAGGAEATLEKMLEVFPNAPIYTSIYEPKNFKNSIISNSKVITPKNNLLLKTFPKFLTFLMPTVFESFDLSDYDIIISDSSSYAKGVISTSNQLHISYIHTPPRFLYKYSVESTKRNAWYFKPFVAVIDMFLRIWDFAAAQRPDYLLTNSNNTQKRIKKFYRRDATIIYPPVETEQTQSKEKLVEHEYFLAIGRIATYKNFDLLVKAFNLIENKLVIAGTGKELTRLKKLANSNIKFLGRVSEYEKQILLKNCKGLIFPVEEEDFGIVPIEAMAYGKPILAHNSGGVLETVTNEVGLLFDNFEIENVIAKIKEFDEMINQGKFNSEKIIQNAKRFDKDIFKVQFKNFVNQAFARKFENARTS